MAMRPCRRPPDQRHHLTAPRVGPAPGPAPPPEPLPVPHQPPETDVTDPEAWRTDPRERLLAAIDRTWARGELGATPEQLVDGYAHQLAEQQRQDIDVKTHTGESAYTCEDCAVVRAAASIDPEAQR